ncbi:MAG: DUF3604 domain-containing protein [Promethearchaeia archaeon]
MKFRNNEDSDKEKRGFFQSIKKKLSNRNTLIKTIILMGILVTWFGLIITPSVAFDNEPVQLWVHCPSYEKSGEEFEFTVQAWDWSERLSKSYKGKVSFSLISFDLDDPNNELESVDKDLPDDYRFDGTWINTGGLPPSLFLGDVGKKTFNMKINTPGIHYVQVQDDQGFEAISSPIVILNEEPKQELLWGDIHTHSFISDGSGLPEQVMEFARDSALLDFYSLTDHGEGTGLNTEERAQWRIDHNQRVTEGFNKENEFVSFQGVEWTTNFGLVDKEYGYGHYTLVSDANEPIRIARGKQTSPEELWNYLDEYCEENDAHVIAIPHHLTQTNFEMDWAGANEKYVKTASIFSVHGASLLRPDQEENHLGMVHVHKDSPKGISAADALKMGFRFGLVANSDGHDGHPGHAICHKATHYPDQYPILSWTPRYGHPYPGGLTGAWVENFNRDGIMESIRKGKVCATRAPYRPIVNFSVNGVMVGENDSLTTVQNNTSERNIEFQLFRDGLELGWEGKANMNEWETLTVEIWKNSEIWNSTTSEDAIIDLNFSDEAQINGTAYTDYDIRDGKYYMHERALEEVENPDELNTGGKDYYFARAYSGEGTKDDFYLWIGPIWVDPLS